MLRGQEDLHSLPGVSKYINSKMLVALLPRRCDKIRGSLAHEVELHLLPPNLLSTILRVPGAIISRDYVGVVFPAPVHLVPEGARRAIVARFLRSCRGFAWSRL